MTLKGKRKVLENNPAAQIAAIKEAYRCVPVRPLFRHHPAVTWVENGKFYTARLSGGKLGVKVSDTKPKDIIMADCPGAASGYLSKTYCRKVGLPDLKMAENRHLPAPTLEESQTAVICWKKDRRMILRAATFNRAAVSSLTFEYCVVNAGGIRSGTTKGLPILTEGSPGPLIEVESAVAGINLLRNAFKLKVSMADLQQSFGKEMKIAKIPPANQPPEPREKNIEEGKT